MSGTDIVKLRKYQNTEVPLGATPTWGNFFLSHLLCILCQFSSQKQFCSVNKKKGLCKTKIAHYFENNIRRIMNLSR